VVGACQNPGVDTPKGKPFRTGRICNILTEELYSSLQVQHIDIAISVQTVNPDLLAANVRELSAVGRGCIRRASGAPALDVTITTDATCHHVTNGNLAPRLNIVSQCRSVIDVGWSCPLPGGCGFSVRRPLAARLP
jgi:hypothetical protein